MRKENYGKNKKIVIMAISVIILVAIILIGAFIIYPNICISNIIIHQPEYVSRILEYISLSVFVVL